MKRSTNRTYALMMGRSLTNGVVSPATVDALERFCDRGRKLLLVTGGELPDLMRDSPRLDLFDRVVAENGALIYCPATREEQSLGEAPPDMFVNALRERDIAPLSVGRVIVESWRPGHPNEEFDALVVRVHEHGLRAFWYPTTPPTNIPGLWSHGPHATI